jgi:hypothetical protein
MGYQSKVFFEGAGILLPVSSINRPDKQLYSIS